MFVDREGSRVGEGCEEVRFKALMTRTEEAELAFLFEGNKVK
ncbi:hypothetical protein COLO4_32941 [Corchorus olitorius]|uniref:Uncharacterized protein n=1 Tax=Corchorus olitorius TaxID=93759 RepID=A0A1R3GX37_9ROSI|nr:hypothetical protein COLO4_32941 [Corchorus olitorius]